MSVRDEIIKVLTENLKPLYLEVDDFSEQHRGHAGYRAGGESHFAVLIVADSFSGKSRPERQRMVYGLLDPQLRGNIIHALTLKTLTPSEAENRQQFH